MKGVGIVKTLDWVVRLVLLSIGCLQELLGCNDLLGGPVDIGWGTVGACSGVGRWEVAVGLADGG